MSCTGKAILITLPPFGNIIINILKSSNILITGSFHIGAHECEEISFYNSLGLELKDMIWIEALNNKVIELNFYPTEKTKYSNMKHRPMGIGVQGIADVYNIFKYPWDSEDAYKLNKQIFEHMYYACIDESKELAKKYGHYESFPDSPFSKGQLQWHMWNVDIKNLSPELEWSKLIEEVKTYGTRNSLLTALMPTASTSQIMKCSECFEPYMSNIFTRSTLAGEFVVINENLIFDLDFVSVITNFAKSKIEISSSPPMLNTWPSVSPLK